MAGQVQELLCAPRIVMSELQAATFGGCPDIFRGVVWKLLLSYYPLVRDERPAHVQRLRTQYHEWVGEIADVHPPSFSNALNASVDESVDAAIASSEVITEFASTVFDAATSASSPMRHNTIQQSPLPRTPNVFGSPSSHGHLPDDKARRAALDALFALEGGGDDKATTSTIQDLFDDEGVLRGGTSAPPVHMMAMAKRRSRRGVEPASDNDTTNDTTNNTTNDDTDEDHFPSTPSRILLPPIEMEETTPTAALAESPVPSSSARVADAELRCEIFKDVERTHADLSFFAISAHTDALSRILLVYAKLNAGVGYIQGMNELLAPLLFVCVGDVVGLRGGIGGEGGAAAEVESEVLHGGPLFAAEADAFFLFASLMAEHRDVFIQAQDNSSSGIRGQLTRFGRMLLRREPVVAARLDAHHIPPDFYAMRWLTALASREFNFPDTLMLWDSLFADPERFAFLRQVCVAIVRTQRETLLLADFATTVKLLQRPPLVDFVVLLSTAVQVRAEENAERAAATARPVAKRGGGGGW